MKRALTVTLTRLGSVLSTGVAALFLTGCADLGYYWQSVSSHLQMMYAAGPVEDWLADAHTPAQLKSRLALAQRIRGFAVTELKLPDNASYHRYANLHRKSAVWNVAAAPEFSLTLKTWCFPVAGCVGYRGYFDEAKARTEAAQLAAQGFEVSVYGVPAYSTLGWRRPVAEHLHRLPRWGTGAPDFSRAGAPGGVCQGRHDVQRVICHCRGAHGQPALAGQPGQQRSPQSLCRV